MPSRNSRSEPWKSLIGDGFRLIDEALNRSDAGVRSLQNLHAVRNPVKQVGDIAGAIVEACGGEEVGGIVERRIDLFAGRQIILGGRQGSCGILQGQQILTYGRGQNNPTHFYNSGLLAIKTLKPPGFWVR